MLLTEARWTTILKSKWLRILLLTEIIFSVSAMFIYFQLCGSNWLEMAKGIFCNQLALVCAISWGTITFGATLDHPVLKKMLVKMIYQQKIANFIKHTRVAFQQPQPEFIKAIQKWHLAQCIKEQNFEKWKLNQLLVDPLQTIHRVAKLPAIVRTLQNIQYIEDEIRAA